MANQIPNCPKPRDVVCYFGATRNVEKQFKNKDLITYFSKKNCPPCIKYYAEFQKLFASKNFYNKIEIETDEEALEIVEKYNTRTFPFLVLNHKIVIPTNELILMLFSSVLKTPKVVEIVT